MKPNRPNTNKKSQSHKELLSVFGGDPGEREPGLLAARLSPPGRMLLFTYQVAVRRLAAGLEGKVLWKRDTGDAAPYHMTEISTLGRKEKE